MTPRRYEVILSPAAEKQLMQLPKPIQRRITKAIEGLELTPRPQGIKNWQGPRTCGEFV